MGIFNHFQHIQLTDDQRIALDKMQHFLNSENHVFLLKGYAGSGKTTLLKGICSYLTHTKQKYQLMAPTGRAAKVINQKTGFEATTIHKGIYSFNELEDIKKKEDDKNNVSFRYYFKLRNEPEVHNSVLIVDEASMVSDTLQQGEFFRFGSGYLLQDLLRYSRIDSPNSTVKIIFIGDPAQLPPVGMNFSPALSKKHLNEHYNLTVIETEMKEVKRQASDNGILTSATKIRQCLTAGYFNDFELKENKKDIFSPSYASFLETYKKVKCKKIIISYKNKTAVELNRTIRHDKYDKDLPIQAGDIIIVGGNNYRLDIMNGEFGVISNAETITTSREVRFYSKGDKKNSVLLTWRKIELLIPTQQSESKTVVGYMLENYLNGDNDLTPEEQRALYVDFKNRHPKLKPKTQEFKEAITSDDFFNPILLKYGYAVTCHKAQGGEWDAAFVFWDKGVATDFNFYNAAHQRFGKTNSEFYRWAYTSITRASKKLYCVNPPRFNSFSEISFIDVSVQNSLQELTGKEVKPIEIELTDEKFDLLRRFNLENVPISYQQHFLELNYIVQNQGIEMTSWKKLNYEIRYSFKRGNHTASIKFWVNGKNTFKSNFLKLPAETNSDSLFEEISKLIENAPKIILLKNIAQPTVIKIDFDTETEAEKPFLKTLFSSLQVNLADSGISITAISHHNYRERYTFEKGKEKAVIDFEYNGKGFFGRVLPIENQCNSESMLQTISQIITNLKSIDYVI